MPISRVCIALLGLFILSAGQSGAAALVSVDANTPYIPADGKSYTQILVTVFEGSGSPVADGSEVRLTTTAGDVSPITYTTGGRATGILTSSNCPQTAIVQAFCSGGVGSVQVEFTTPVHDGDTAARESSISMTGGSLAYCVERDTIIGSSGIILDYKGMTIEADSLQMRQSTGLIRVQGNVAVRRGETGLDADELVVDTRSDRIYLRERFDDTEIKVYDAANLRPVNPATLEPSANAFAPLPDVQGSTWLVSSRLTVIPRQKILFFKASIYVRDSKVMTLPYYSYSFKDRQSILQQVRYTSNDGMTVDLPFYCQLAENRASAVKLRYSGGSNESGGYARPRKGPSLGLQHDYLTGNMGYGTMFVDSVGNSNQAYELGHHLEYGSALHTGRADLSTRYQPSSKYAKAIHYTTLSISGNLPKYTYSVLGYYSGSKIKQSFLPGGYLDQSNSSLRGMVRSNKAIASTPVGNVFPSLTVGYGMPGGSLSSCLYQTVGLSANRSKRLSGPFTASFAQSAAFTLTGDGDTGSEMRLRPSVRTNWMGGSASLGYTLNLRSGLNNLLWSQGKHQLDAGVSFDLGDRLSCNSMVDFGLDSKRMNLFSTLNYQASRLYEIRTSFDLYKYHYQMGSSSFSYKTSYFRIGIFRPVGLYEVGLVWSPNGQQYGSINQGKHLWLELGGIGF